MDARNINDVIVVANGEIKDYTQLRKAIDSFHIGEPIIISVDGGVENTLKLGLMPHIIIGDMDSIDRKKYTNRLSGAEFIPAPVDKDESDTRLAVEYAHGMGARDIIITGATGGRIDHTFANIMILASPGLEDSVVRIVTEKSVLFCMDQPGVIRGKPGKLVSIFSLTPYTTFIRTSGLKYGLADERLEQSPVRGLSNMFTSDEAVLEFKDGKLLIIKEI